MDNQKYTEDFGRMREKINDLFKELITDEFDDTWADTFEVTEADEKLVVVTYHGAQDFKKFKKECKEMLVPYIYSVYGGNKKIKIVKTKKSNSVSPKTKKNIRATKFFVLGMAFVCFAAVIVIVMSNYIGNRNFRETFYSVSSLKVDSGIRVIQLSDLHSCTYGENNATLLSRVKELKPDVILCTGDIVDSAQNDVSYAVDLGQKLSEIAPSYYIYGNNEVESIYDFPLNEKELDANFGFDANNRDETALLKAEDAFEEKLENAGIKVLKNEKDTIRVKTMTIDIFGVLTSNPSSFWSYSGKSFQDYIYENPDNLKITAIHEPFIFEEFETELWGDLMLCGHTHGGVVRIPVLGPLYTKEGGILPQRDGRFVYGRYTAAGKPLIVSGGLENSNVFRINNQPELVVIDINKF